MSTTFFLVRHALKEKAIGDVPITPKGVSQAQATARHFSNRPIAALYSSPLRRAKETAEYIALETKAPVQVDDRLRNEQTGGTCPGNLLTSLWPCGSAVRVSLTIDRR
ncbi:histidine phosphatase family protein [Paenibacillus flagellatus]|uniref:histidine phosphatase family protein n=1 Tax=Paenibacillus flagellatus TaxID=2211139 RepID=UPI001FECBB07|nr:histidine phosphatase family protein [Paenibacillus flagellatus]